MGFSGKPSKGCLPCRQKRTKCDLALPSCTQCLRKNRMCFGYRNEQDMVFRNETGLVIRKVKRKNTDDQSTPPSSEDAFATLDLGALVQHPSRRATLQDEAIMHWLSNFNERFFSSNPNVGAGFEYILPVYRGDLARGGPTVEIINACGLAALGNSKNSPDLLRAARIKQMKVLRRLNEQLQDPEHALSDSSVLTCLLLSSFENIMCEGTHSMAASRIHLKGAATLIKQRGVSQFSNLVGHGMFVRLRGSILALSLMMSEPLPNYFLQHLKEEGHKEDDFEVVFFSLLSRVCALRAQHKNAGFVSDAMAEDAKATLQLLDNWHPDFPSWVMPCGHRSFNENASAPGVAMASNVDRAHRFIWVAMSWLLLLTARLLVCEILIVYYRAQQVIAPSSDTDSALRIATTAQIDVAQDTQDAVEYYYETLISTRATTRSIGAHMLMLPLSILLGLSTTGSETLAWIAKMAGRIAEAFALKQGKFVADFLLKGWQEQTFALSSVERSLSPANANDQVEAVGITGEGSKTAELLEGDVLVPISTPIESRPEGCYDLKGAQQGSNR